MAALGVNQGCLDRVGDVASRAGRVRAGRTRQVKDRVRRGIERAGDVLLEKLESGIAEKLLDVGPGAGDQVVDAENFRALANKTVAEVRADESRPACNDSPHDENSTARRSSAISPARSGWRCMARRAMKTHQITAASTRK